MPSHPTTDTHTTLAQHVAPRYLPHRPRPAAAPAPLTADLSVNELEDSPRTRPAPRTPVALAQRLDAPPALTRAAPASNIGLETSVHVNKAPTSILVSATANTSIITTTTTTPPAPAKRASVKFAETSPPSSAISSSSSARRSRITRRSSIRADAIDSVSLSSFSSPTADATEMRFASPSRPSLTPLGWRLISLSEQKLYDIDASPVGARESGSALRKGVLVREAVKSAWRSVEDGQRGEMNDWHSATAMGLDVIGENDEEEEEEEQQEEKWFEDLLSSLGEEEVRVGAEQYQPAEWAESEVKGVDYEEYDYEEMEAYTIPLPPSPTVAPKMPSPVLAPVAAAPVATFPTSTIHHFTAPSLAEARTTVDIVSVDDLETVSVSAPEYFDHAAPVFTFTSDHDTGSPVRISSVPHVEAHSDSDSDSTSLSVSDYYNPDSFLSIADSLSSSLATSMSTSSPSSVSALLCSPLSAPLTPISPITPIERAITASSTGFMFAETGQHVRLPDISELEDECACEDGDDLLLPPPLHRSYSSTSTTSAGTCDSYDEQCECRTPPLRASVGPSVILGFNNAYEDACEELEVERVNKAWARWQDGVQKAAVAAEDGCEEFEGLVF